MMAWRHPLTGIDMQTDWTKVLAWPGYRVYHSQIDEARRLLTLWVRRKPGNRKLTCSHCGRRVHHIRAVYERKVRDLPCFQFRTTVLVECFLIRCPDCGVNAERNPQLPSKAPHSKRFEDAVGEACEGAAARQVARRMRLAQSTVRAIDLRFLERWEAERFDNAVRKMFTVSKEALLKEEAKEKRTREHGKPPKKPCGFAQGSTSRQCRAPRRATAVGWRDLLASDARRGRRRRGRRRVLPKLNLANSSAPRLRSSAALRTRTTKGTRWQCCAGSEPP
jgi:zinc-finger of transposase IS204/IS1001/IS1096/IS1165